MACSYDFYPLARSHRSLVLNHQKRANKNCWEMPVCPTSKPLEINYARQFDTLNHSNQDAVGVIKTQTRF